MERDGLNGEAIGELRQLMRLGAHDMPYILHYSTWDEKMKVYTTGLSKRHQYLRVLIAERIGIPDPDWDWGHTQRIDLLRAAYDQLKNLAWDQI
jgi:hypothetical protein